MKLLFLLFTVVCFSQDPIILLEDIDKKPLVRLKKNCEKELNQKMDSLYADKPLRYNRLYLHYIVLKGKDTVYNKQTLYKRKKLQVL